MLIAQVKDRTGLSDCPGLCLARWKRTKAFDGACQISFRTNHDGGKPLSLIWSNPMSRAFARRPSLINALLAKLIGIADQANEP
jgi:hypothetical protein